MRCLVQRVASASVTVGSVTVGEIGHGLLVLVCAMSTDTDGAAINAAHKISTLRVFRDQAGKMNRSVMDVDGSMLVVSQFTLAADTSRGNRPGFSAAAAPVEGERLFEVFVEAARSRCPDVKTGRFGAEMMVHLVNDGPVTIWLDNK